jgi:hypothetical protein
MVYEITSFGLLIVVVYGGLSLTTAILTYGRAYRLRMAYRQLFTPVLQPIEQIPTNNLHDTQELKPVLRKMVSTEISLYIQPDAEVEIRAQAEINRHKRNLRRIIDHITSPPLAS